MTNSAATNLEEVAIIGLSCRFPRARNVDEFWPNLREGIEGISFFTEEELKSSGISEELLQDPNYIRAKGVLDDVEMFDASFFGFTPREAEIMDPQQRLFLECAWEALEQAGYDFEDRNERVGVYGGSGMSTYLLVNLLSNPELIKTVDPLQFRMLNDKDFLTTHVSYKLNLKGPSVAVQTACSTSLVAVHLACQSLLDGECDLALAGGVTVTFPHKAGYHYQEGGILSPDGHCRAFDSKAQGTVEGNGAGVVVLKRLSNAIADGDHIHAVIKGSAVNNDGSFKVGFTAPSVETQTDVVIEALSMAGVSPETITFIEAHGSGTPLGDPIEVLALTRAFRSGAAKKNFCALGSVKTNVGHCDNAAGMASLIKTVLALEHKLIPPTLHFEGPGAQINLDDSPFYINSSAVDWNMTGDPRRAGVSSLGIGGTNAHLILEEAPQQKPSRESGRAWQLLVLSAKTDAAVKQSMSNLAVHLKQHPDIDLNDVAYTLQAGRRRFNHRRALICRDIPDAIAALEGDDPKFVLREVQESRDREVTFMFPGLGDHHPAMAQDLYRNEPAFRNAVDRCSELLKPHLDLDIREVLYPKDLAVTGNGAPAKSFSPQRTLNLRKLLTSNNDSNSDEFSRRLNQTRLAQPSVFVIEYALTQLLAEWGIHPHSMIGYSIGEYAAACVAGVFSLEDTLSLVATRARMIDELPAGEMLAVPLPADELKPLLDDGLCVSATNGPSLTVVGGAASAVRILEQRLDERGVAFRQLQTTHAFHTEMMEPVISAFTDRVRQIQLNPPKVPFVSNLTGTWITNEQATDPEYWSRHMRHAVRFAEGLNTVFVNQHRVLLEVGPGQGLSMLARQHPQRNSQQPVFPTMRDRRDEVSDVPFLFSTLGRLWLAGARIDWTGFSAHYQHRRIPLPTYPFERKRYWVEPGRSKPEITSQQDLNARQSDLADWFYIPVWKQAPLLASSDSLIETERTSWLIFTDSCGLGVKLAETLRAKGHFVVSVAIGESFQSSAEDSYTINPHERSDYDALLAALAERGSIPGKIVHLWGVTAEAPANELDAYDRSLAPGFYSLLFLAQSLGERGVTTPIQIGVVTSQAYVVAGDESTCPLKATVSGAGKVIPQEYPNISCTGIDVISPTSGDPAAVENLARQLFFELATASANQTVAYRGGRRWVRGFERIRIEQHQPQRTKLRKGETYLITGGNEETGLMLAERLAYDFGTKIVLIVAPTFPPANKWERWLSAHDGNDETSRQIRRIRAIEASGHEVLAIAADVCDREQMRDAVAKARARFGEIRGVIHAVTPIEAGIIQLKTRESASAMLDPKIKGALILASVTGELPLDFFALCSSTLSLAGGFGQVDACAANSFLDAFAHYRSVTSNCPTFAINWSAFQWDTWQLPSGTGFSELSTNLQESLKTFGIQAAEAVAAFDRIISSPLSQVIVSPRDLQKMLDETDAMTAATLMQAVAEARSSEMHSRPELDVAYIPPTSEPENRIAAVWQQAFGLEKVGINDNFFELSGNSLLAIQIVTRLRDVFKVQLPLTSLFEAPTISQLAQKIEELQSPSELSDMSRMLSEIEALTLDEAEEKFARELKTNY
jgi:acyl transferase domain-containing protein/acyl carrier protein